MNFRRFEWIVLVIGSVPIVGAVVMVLVRSGRLEPVETVAQFLLLWILVTAVLGGRPGGLAASLTATLVYVLLRTWGISVDEWTASFALSLALRVLSFGVLGVLLGETSSRAPYEIARATRDPGYDDWSRVFGQPQAFDTISELLRLFAQSGRPFGVVVVSPAVAPLEATPAMRRRQARSLAARLRSEVRPSQPVARLNDGRFVILLPSVRARSLKRFSGHLEEALRERRGDAPESLFTVTAYAVPEDEPEVRLLLEEISPSSDESSDSPADPGHSLSSV